MKNEKVVVTKYSPRTKWFRLSDRTNKLINKQGLVTFAYHWKWWLLIGELHESLNECLNFLHADDSVASILHAQGWITAEGVRMIWETGLTSDKCTRLWHFHIFQFASLLLLLSCLNWILRTESNEKGRYYAKSTTLHSDACLTAWTRQTGS